MVNKLKLLTPEEVEKFLDSKKEEIFKLAYDIARRGRSGYVYIKYSKDKGLELGTSYFTDPMVFYGISSLDGEILDFVGGYEIENRRYVRTKEHPEYARLGKEIYDFFEEQKFYLYKYYLESFEAIKKNVITLMEENNWFKKVPKDSKK